VCWWLLLLPLGAMLYLDILEAKHEVKEQVEKVEKLRREFERKQREQNRKEPDAIGDNPVFDRVRRPLSLPLPRPENWDETECKPPICTATGTCPDQLIKPEKEKK
jgi:hypothetical protein